MPNREALVALWGYHEDHFKIRGYPLFKRKVERYKGVLDCVDRYQAAVKRCERHRTDLKCVTELEKATVALEKAVEDKVEGASVECAKALDKVRNALNRVSMPAQFVPHDNLERKGSPAVTPGHSRTGTVWHVSPMAGAAPQIVKHDTRGSLVGEAALRAGITGRWSDRAVATAALARQLGLGHLVPETRAVESKAGKSVVMDLAPGMPPQAIGSLRVRLPADLNDIVRSRLDLLAKYVAERGYTGHDYDAAQGVLTLHNLHKNARALIDAHGQPVVNLRGEPVREDARGPIFTRVDYRRGDVRRGITEAQWLDTMTGETDRNDGNLHVDLDERGALRSVSVFDNETAFSPLIDSADAGVGLVLSAQDPDSPRVSHRAHMAGAIGATLKRAIEGFEPDILDTLLGDLPAQASKLLAVDVAKRLRDGKAMALGDDKDWERDAVALALGLLDFEAKFDRVAAQARQAPEATRTRTLMTGLRAVCNTAHDTSYVARGAACLALQDWLARHGREWPGAPAPAPVYSHADLRKYMDDHAKELRRMKSMSSSSSPAPVR
ncbi:MAG: hypothetical protein V4609_11865 [Pseudomonadota bacterium]